MVNLLMAAALATATLAAALDALVLRRVETCCRRIEQRPSIDRDLIRWYARGFERPTALAGWLLAACLALTVAGILGHATPALAFTAATLTIVTFFELNFGHRRRRYHVAMARR